MGIALGNLTVEQMEHRLGIIFTHDERTVLNQSRQDVCANMGKDKWHCYDIPFIIECGSLKMATTLYDILYPYSSKMKCPIQVGITQKKEGQTDEMD